jgi:hypothetical protein
MKSLQKLIATYWLIHSEPDLSEPFQMRELGEDGVFEPTFESGRKCMLSMAARFDPEDPGALYSAVLYLYRNACKLQHDKTFKIWQFEVYLNGNKLPFEK